MERRRGIANQPRAVATICGRCAPAPSATPEPRTRRSDPINAFSDIYPILAVCPHGDALARRDSGHIEAATATRWVSRIPVNRTR